MQKKISKKLPKFEIRSSVQTGTLTSPKLGSALILTLLMVSVISTISFGLTVLTNSEFRKVASIQDSLAAFYAAESGIEHGLMQHRLWRDAELSTDIYDNVHAGTAVPDVAVPTKTFGTGQTFRTDLMPIGFVINGKPKGNTWYNLKMWYRGSVIGKLDGSGNPVVDAALSPRIFRDSALQLNVRGATGFRISWEADVASQSNVNFPPPLENTGYFVEVILTDSRGLCPLFRDVLRGEKLIDKNNREVPFGSCAYDTLRIKPWNMVYMQYSLVLQKNGTNMKFDNQISNIQATGYSGKAKRTLQIGISRASGTILESEDFLLLSGDERIEF